MQRKLLVSNMIKGILLGCGLTVLLIFVTAFLMQQLIIDENGLVFAAVIIKLLGAALASKIALKGCEAHLLPIGGLSGLIYYFISSLVCMLLGGNFKLDMGFFSDALICTTAGIVVSIFIMLLKNRTGK